MVAAIAWLTRSLVGQILSRDIERYKSHLENLTEQFKSELAREAKEHEVRFTTLHEKRRAAIAELYVALANAIRTHQTIGFVASFDPDQLQGLVDKAFHDFTRVQEHFVSNRIYFSGRFAVEIEPVLASLEMPLVRLATHLLHQRDDATVAELVEDIQRGFDDANALLNLVETRFREMLGVESDPAAARPDLARLQKPRLQVPR